MRVTLISHSYLAPENRKKLSSLGKFVELEVLSPREWNDSMLFSFNENNELINGDNWHLRLYKQKAHHFLRGMYLFPSFDLNVLAYRPDILHIEYDPWVPMALQTILVRSILTPSTPVVCTVKQNTYGRHNMILSFIKKRIASYVVNKVDRYIAVSRRVSALYKVLLGVPDSKFTHVTHLGVDTQLFSPVSVEGKQSSREALRLDPDSLIVGYVGRFVERKGLAELIEAVHQIGKDAPQRMELVLLGGGPMKPELLNLSRDMPWLHVLDLVPHHEVSGILQCLDVFVLPSWKTPDWEEHDAHALLEAMATGLPSIGTTSGAMPEILEGVGITVEPGSAQAIRDALVRLVLNPDLRHSYAIAARQKALDLYSNEAVAAQTYAVYQEVIGARG